MQRHLERIAEVARDAEALRARFFEESAERIVAVAERLARSLRGGGTLFFFGNGGSAADAQHIAAEFVNKLDQDREPLRALALTTDSSALTSIGNDRSYDEVFSRQLQALGRRDDVAVGITTSGNSPNVLEALAAARERGIVTIGLLGRDGGKALALCDEAIVVPHRDTQRIQEIHLMTIHLVAELSERMVIDAQGAR